MNNTCPFCGGPLEYGRLKTRLHSRWAAYEERPYGPPAYVNQMQLGSPLTGTAINGYRCEQCQRIILEYAGAEQPEDTGDSLLGQLFDRIKRP